MLEKSSEFIDKRLSQLRYENEPRALSIAAAFAGVCAILILPVDGLFWLLTGNAHILMTVVFVMCIFLASLLWAIWLRRK